MIARPIIDFKTCLQNRESKQKSNDDNIEDISDDEPMEDWSSEEDEEEEKIAGCYKVVLIRSIVQLFFVRSHDLKKK